MKNKFVEKFCSNIEQKSSGYLKSFDSIPYIKELKELELVDSIVDCLVMAKFEMLFSESPEGFSKYQAPCKWQADLGGLSWREELGFTKTHLLTSFSKLVTRYTTEEEYLQAEDKFKGKYYCMFKDAPHKNGSFYFRNNDLVNNSLERLFIIKTMDGMRKK